jgi:hypothetical protein
MLYKRIAGSGSLTEAKAAAKAPVFVSGQIPYVTLNLPFKADTKYQRFAISRTDVSPYEVELPLGSATLVVPETTLLSTENSAEAARLLAFVMVAHDYRKGSFVSKSAGGTESIQINSQASGLFTITARIQKDSVVSSYHMAFDGHGALFQEVFLVENSDKPTQYQFRDSQTGKTAFLTSDPIPGSFAVSTEDLATVKMMEKGQLVYHGQACLLGDGPPLKDFNGVWHISRESVEPLVIYGVFENDKLMETFPSIRECKDNTLACKPIDGDSVVVSHGNKDNGVRVSESGSAEDKCTLTALLLKHLHARSQVTRTGLEDQVESLETNIVALKTKQAEMKLSMEEQKKAQEETLVSLRVDHLALQNLCEAQKAQILALQTKPAEPELVVAAVSPKSSAQSKMCLIM